MTRASSIRFLRSAGALPVWGAFVYAAIVVYGIAEAVLGGQSETAVYLWLFHLPIAAGTGLLTIAREGQLDLLFGAGVRRDQVWLRALMFSVAAPIAVGLVIASFALPHRALAATANQGLRFLGIAAFTGSAGFAIGLLRPRYAAGVAWLALRLLVLLSRWALDIVAQLRNATDATLPLARWPKLTVAVLLFPELLLEPRLPMAMLAVPAAMGLIAIVISNRVFLAADFGGGRRSA